MRSSNDVDEFIQEKEIGKLRGWAKSLTLVLWKTGSMYGLVDVGVGSLAKFTNMWRKKSAEHVS